MLQVASFFSDLKSHGRFPAEIQMPPGAFGQLLPLLKVTGIHKAAI